MTDPLDPPTIENGGLCDLVHRPHLHDPRWRKPSEEASMTRYAKHKASLRSQIRLMSALVELMETAETTKAISVAGHAAFDASVKCAKFALLHHHDSLEKTNDAEREVRAAIDLIKAS